MLKALLKKQFAETFKGYFYNQKTNKARTPVQTVILFVLFAVLMFAVVGGMFIGLAIGMCSPLHAANADWLYFSIFSLLAILLGLFGSVFNTYASLYLAKDNDALISMPIPPKYIVISRLANVYLLGLLYGGIVFIPAVAVYLIVCGATILNLLGGLTMFFAISSVVFALSCLLGWVIAKISQKLKGKSIVTTLISLVFIGAYYFVYFKAQDYIQNIVDNAGEIADGISSSASFLVFIGNCGKGNPLSVIVLFAVSVILLVACCTLMSRSFLAIATTSSVSKSNEYKAKKTEQKPIDRVLLSKEFCRFTSSSNYMLNCGFGALMILAFGVFVLIKGGEFVSNALPSLEGVSAIVPVVIAGILGMLSSTCDTAAPSVSLEGKTLWILQSLPVDLNKVIWAKIKVQLCLTLPVLLFAGICFSIVFPLSIAEKVLIIILSLICAVFNAEAGMVIGIKFPMMTWTNEVMPIKQSASVCIALLGGWGYTLITGGIEVVLAIFVNPIVGLVSGIIINAVLSYLLYLWLKNKGTKILATL